MMRLPSPLSRPARPPTQARARARARARAVSVALVWWAVLIGAVLLLHPHPSLAKSFTKTNTGQRDVLAVVDRIQVLTDLHREVDGGRPWCQAEPTIFYIFQRVVVGNPRRHIDFSVSTSSPLLLFPDLEVAVSQTVKTPPVTVGSCTAGVPGSDLLYIGSGTTQHSLAVLNGQLPFVNGEPISLALPPRFPGTGVLGLGLDPAGDVAPDSQRVRDTYGVWTRDRGTGLGWNNASMYFGDVHTKGWIMFNATHRHPFSHANPESYHLRATPAAGKGYVLRQPVRLIIGDMTWERQGVFLPELPFIEIPEDMYDAAIMPLGINVHMADEGGDLEEVPWFKRLSGAVSLDVDAGGPAPPIQVHQNAFVVDHEVGDLGDIAKYFLFRRSKSGTSEIRFGCAPFRLNAFLDAVAFTAPQQHGGGGANSSEAGAEVGTVSIYVARVEDVERMHTFNVLMFPALVALVVVYTMGTALTQNVLTQEIEAPTHSLLLELHHGWNMEIAELLSAGCSLATVLVNTEFLDLVPRYAYLMDADLETSQTFADLSLWMIMVLAPLHAVVVILEMVSLYRSRRSYEKGHKRSRARRPHHSGSAANTDIQPMAVAKALSVAVAPLASITQTISSNEVVIGTLRMWNFHLIVRRICMQFCSLTALALTVMEGPRKGYNVRILAFVVMTALIVPCRMFVGLANALFRDIAGVGDHPRARCCIRLQVLVYTVATVAFVVFAVAFLVEPLFTMVFPVFPTTTLWGISALASLLVLGIGVSTQINHMREHPAGAAKPGASATPRDLISTMEL